MFMLLIEYSADMLLCRWDLALKLLTQMQVEGLRPSSGCLTSAINACLQGDRAS
jgi:pentatricopeptide repeat protein